MSSRYHEVYAFWQRDPEAFWAEAAREIDWYKPWDKVFDPYAGQYGRWFVGAECNTAYNCLDRHVERGRGGQKALIHDSPVTNSIRSFTYAELTDEVATLGAVLQDLGVKPGDRVIIYMPMVAEAVIAMLACARIGAIHSVVFGGFAAPELAARIEDATPVAILAASCGIEPGRVVAYKPLLDSAIAQSKHKPSKVLMLQRPMAEATMVAGRDHDWAGAIADAKRQGRTAGCVAVKATDPLYILYTSGTTGAPKGVVRDNGGHMVALKWTMKNHYDVDPGEAYWAASDVGWVVGHSYIVYAPLLHGCTSIIYEGKPVGTPDPGAFWRVISEHKVAAMFTAPTAFRAIKKEDPKGEHIKRYDLSAFRTLFLAGERADPETIKWAEANLKVPVYDHWWQTETGWPICGNPVGLGALPVKYGSPTVPMPGYDLQVLDNAAKPVKPGETGTLAVKLPLPPSCLPTLWNNDKRFRDSYLAEFPGYYTTSDAGYMDADGYAFVMARTDDVINVAGHRLSTGQMEEVVARHKDVAECAVVGVADAMKGQIPAGFIVLNAGVNRPPSEIESEVVKLVREEIGPVAAFKTVMVVKRLPKTRSGKILRGTMRQIADGETWKMPATIDDPVILDEITGVMQDRGMVREAADKT
ncbi:MAG TPA: propionyl-CoA synthetase [Hyphomicrobiaceae bacterium]|jgi:propionyl-CoA synthetase|nr:propionyl-CoA synthetase [Hyphomicrobiaceae bacterium]